MFQNHPDRGGSPYIAAKINEAKDYLEKQSTNKWDLSTWSMIFSLQEFYENTLNGVMKNADWMKEELMEIEMKWLFRIS